MEHARGPLAPHVADHAAAAAHPSDPALAETLLLSLTRLVSRWSSLDLQRRVAEACDVSLDPVAVRALYALGISGDAVSPSSIADELHLTRPSTSKLLARLEALELITRDRDAADGRSIVVSLTPQGSETFRRLFAAGIDMMRDATDGWHPDEARMLGALLERFIGGLLTDSSGPSAPQRSIAPQRSVAPQRSSTPQQPSALPSSL